MVPNELSNNCFATPRALKNDSFLCNFTRKTHGIRTEWFPDGAKTHLIRSDNKSYHSSQSAVRYRPWTFFIE